MYITKGDSGSFFVKLTKKSDGSEYVLKDGDKIVMTVRRRPRFPVLMSVTSTENEVKLRPADTKRLEPGWCVYDIEVNTAEGETYTIVGIKDDNDKNFMVYPEVTE